MNIEKLLFHGKTEYMKGWNEFVMMYHENTKSMLLSKLEILNDFLVQQNDKNVIMRYSGHRDAILELIRFKTGQ